MKCHKTCKTGKTIFSWEGKLPTGGFPAAHGCVAAMIQVRF